MNVCGKCGCEHTSNTTCPKCGAPVVRVNEDYLRRKKEWEEKQKVTVTIATREGTKEIDLNKSKNSKADKEEKQETSVNSIWKTKTTKTRGRAGAKDDDKKQNKIADIFFRLKENIARKKRHKGEDHSLEMASTDEKDIYEKLLLDHIKFKSKRKKYIIIGSIVLAVVAIVYGSYYYVSHIDHSDVAYYDGHEFYSVKDGVYFSLDNYQGYSFVDTDKQMKSILICNSNNNATGNGESIISTRLVCWHEDATNEITVKGGLTNQHLFSDNGEYLALVTFGETGDGAGIEVLGEYNLVIYDVIKNEQKVYSSNKLMEIIALTDDGRVIYTQSETTGYSVVVESSLYAADMKESWLIGEEVKAAIYDSVKDAVAYISRDNLFYCPVDSKFLSEYNNYVPDSAIALVAEEVDACTNDEWEQGVYFFDQTGLAMYDGTQVVRILNKATPSFKIYETESGIYLKNFEALYEYRDGECKQIISQEQGVTTVVGYENGILVLTKEGNLYKADDKACEEIASEIQCVGTVSGNNGFSAIMGGKLYWIRPKSGGYSYILITSSNMTENDNADILYSHKSVYYADSSNVLWKTDVKSGASDTLGYTKNAVYRAK